jgi:hypothetical protein
MKLAIDHLPRSAKILIDLIGLSALLTLVEAFGGRVIWPHRHGAERAHLAELIGEDAAEKLVTTFREPVPIPKCAHAIRAVLHDQLRAEFDALTQAGSSARRAVTHLARQYHYTERHVWRVLKLADHDGEVVETRQAELF